MLNSFKFKKAFCLILCTLILFGIMIQPAQAIDYLDIDYYINNKKDDGYPSNNGKWNVDYIDTLYDYNVITKNEKQVFSNKNKTTTMYEALDLLYRIYSINNNKHIDNITEKNICEFFNISSVSLLKMTKKIQLNKGSFSYLLNIYLNSSNDTKINNIDKNEINDISEKSLFNESIYETVEYGLFELDKNNNFNPYKKLNYEELIKVCARLVNPHLRIPLSLYKDDNVEIQSNEFPMYYKNYDKNLFIEITKKRHYETDCFIAHITMENPSHIKTIYSNLKWSNYGAEINYMNDRLDPIFIVNGDFRSPYIVKGKDLGIVRNNHIIRDMKFNNVLGMTKEGNLVPVKANNAQEVLDSGIKDTWTFGPWLVKDGKAIPDMDNKSNHPRTFIGQKFRDDGMLEYYLIVAEGRSKSDAGLSNYEMGQILEECGVDIGYNLDGGGSSVMMFDGKLISKPSGNYFRADIDYIYVK